MTSSKLNYLLHICSVYRANLKPFLPLVDIFLELAPQAATLVHISYSRAVQERLFNPTIKSLCKDLLSVINTKHTCVSLAYPFRFQSWTSQAKVDLPLLFEFGGWTSGSGPAGVGAGGQVIQPWMAFKILLAVIIPAITQEEDFVKVGKIILLYKILTNENVS